MSPVRPFWGKIIESSGKGEDKPMSGISDGKICVNE